MKTSITKFFGDIKDPRMERRKLYPLEEILLVGLCSMLCGGETYEDMENFGEARLHVLREIYAFENGTASADTYRRVFMLLDTGQFAACFAAWVADIRGRVEGFIPIDGKTSRGSGRGGRKAVHMVSAWCHEHGVVMGQVAAAEKSNEITAIPKLLSMLELGGSVVTLDAMGCQVAIAEQIVGGGGDYIIGLKGNQGNLHADVKGYFEAHREAGWADGEFESCGSQECKRGRKEVRRCTATSDFDGAISSHQGRWASLRSVVCVDYERVEKGSVVRESRYYISSLEADAELLAEGIRSHWGIENSLHWVLDVTMGEDDNRACSGNAPKNLAIMRHAAMNLLSGVGKARGHKRKKIKHAAWNERYILEILKGRF